MPTFTDTTTLALIAHTDQDSLSITCQGVPLPANDWIIDCTIELDTQVSISFAFIDDPALTVSHIDATGQIQLWSGTNPRIYRFGATDGTLAVTAICGATGGGQTAIIPIRIRPKSKPYRG